MDKTTKIKAVVFREERFRVPSPLERSLGLWIDRLGEREDANRKPQYRILGQYAAVLVVRGEGVYEPENGEAVRVKPGDVILLFPKIAARYYPFTTWRTRWVVWNGPNASVLENLGYLAESRPVVTDGMEPITRAYNRLLPVLGKEDKGAALERKIILLEMVRALSGYDQPGRVARPGLDNTMGDVLAYIKTQYQFPLSVTDLAHRFSLSPTHFRRLFKEYTGQGPRAFITAVRMARAKEFLSAGKRVGETARLVGYDDEFYFIRTFKKVTGVTPGKFV